MKSAILKGGHGYWRTDHYPIGGDFRRSGASLPVLLTGKQVDSGMWSGHVEFKVLAGVNGPSEYTGWTDKNGFTDIEWESQEDNS